MNPVGEKDNMWLFDRTLNPRLTALEPKVCLHALKPQPPFSRGGKERRSRKASAVRSGFPLVSAQHAAPALDKRAGARVGLQIRRWILHNRQQNRKKKG